jgi:two-component system sensor histidine kinase QseC
MRSIRAQLVLSLTLGVLALAGASGAGLYAYMEEALEKGIDTALMAKADAIAADVHIEEDGQPHLRLAEATATASAGPHRGAPFAFQIWRADGRTLARVVPGSRDDVPLPRDDGRRRPFADATLPDGTPGRVTQVTFAASPDEEDHDGPRNRATPRSTEPLTMVVWHDRRLEDGTLAVLLTGLLAGAVVTTGGILAIVTLTVRRGLRPLDDVSRLADRIGPDALDVRFPAGDDVPIELRPIGVKLNELLARLQDAFERERRFSAAVAHELRTPVAELRSLCEVAVRWPDDGRAATAAVAEALAIAHEMGAAVENVLLLARCQAGAERLQPEAVNLSAEVDRVLSSVQPRAADRRLTIEREAAHPCVAWVDPRALIVVLQNAVENAVEHATEGGHLRVRTDRAGDHVTLLIGNTSTGLSASDLPHLTEAFWRKDAARTGRTHVGLGLSIADAYCRLAGMELTPRIAADGWFELTVDLPAARG